MIVGRCADRILREFNPYRIFVYASEKSKIERCIKRGENGDCNDRQKIKEQIERIDKIRAKYYAFHTDHKWGERHNYDLCINTTNVDIKKTAIFLASFLL